VLDQWALTSRIIRSRGRHRGAHTLSSLCVGFAISRALHQTKSVARTLCSHHTVCQWFTRYHTRSANAAQSGTRALAKFLYKLRGVITGRGIGSPRGTGTVTGGAVPHRRKDTVRGTRASEHITSATAVSLQGVRVEVDGIGFRAKSGRVHIVKSRVTGTVTARHQFTVFHHCIETHLAGSGTR